MKRNHPEAFMQMASEHRSGANVFQSDTKALDMYIRAAELGVMLKHFGLSGPIVMMVLQWKEMCQNHCNFMRQPQRKETQ